MKLCHTHLHDLLHMLRKKDLASMVSRDKNKAATFGRRWLAGAPISLREFDPLVVSIFEINAKAAQMIGISTGCPLCAAAHHIRSDCDKLWIDSVTDLMAAQVLHMKAQM